MVPDVTSVTLDGMRFWFDEALARSAERNVVTRTRVCLNVPCKQEERKEVLEGGFGLFLMEGGQSMGIFTKVSVEDLKGFTWKGRRADDDKD